MDYTLPEDAFSSIQQPSTDLSMSPRERERGCETPAWPTGLVGSYQLNNFSSIPGPTADRLTETNPFNKTSGSPCYGNLASRRNSKDPGKTFHRQPSSSYLQRVRYLNQELSRARKGHGRHSSLERPSTRLPRPSFHLSRRTKSFAYPTETAQTRTKSQVQSPSLFRNGELEHTFSEVQLHENTNDVDHLPIDKLPDLSECIPPAPHLLVEETLPEPSLAVVPRTCSTPVFGECLIPVATCLKIHFPSTARLGEAPSHLSLHPEASFSPSHSIGVRNPSDLPSNCPLPPPRSPYELDEGFLGRHGALTSLSTRASLDASEPSTSPFRGKPARTVSEQCCSARKGKEPPRQSDRFLSASVNDFLAQKSCSRSRKVSLTHPSSSPSVPASLRALQSPTFGPALLHRQARDIEKKRPREEEADSETNTRTSALFENWDVAPFSPAFNLDLHGPLSASEFEISRNDNEVVSKEYSEVAQLPFSQLPHPSEDKSDEMNTSASGRLDGQLSLHDRSSFSSDDRDPDILSVSDSDAITPTTGSSHSSIHSEHNPVYLFTSQILEVERPQTQGTLPGRCSWASAQRVNAPEEGQHGSGASVDTKESASDCKESDTASKSSKALRLASSLGFGETSVRDSNRASSSYFSRSLESLTSQIKRRPIRRRKNLQAVFGAEFHMNSLQPDIVDFRKETPGSLVESNPLRIAWASLKRKIYPKQVKLKP